MKRYVLIASVCALSACSNGGGGESDYYDSVTKQVARSNRIVTELATEVVVAEDETSRADNQTITKYRLDNVKFDTLITPGEVSELKFTITPNGEIDGVQFVTDSSNVPDAWKEKMNRQVGTNKFISESDENLGVATVSYDTYARELRLRYTDFGVVRFEFVENGMTETMDAPFVGGYEIKKIAASDMPDEILTFDGTARGMVEYANGTEHDSLPVQDTGAKLVFNGGNETLSANFTNWHKMNIAKNGGTVNMVFSTPENPDDDIDSRFQIAGTDATIKMMQTGYYGNNNNPAEAVALVEYQEKINSSGDIDDNNRTVYVGFGGKKPVPEEP